MENSTKGNWQEKVHIFTFITFTVYSTKEICLSLHLETLVAHMVSTPWLRGRWFDSRICNSWRAIKSR